MFNELNKNINWYYNVNQEQRWNDSKVFPALTDNHQLELVMQQEQQLIFISSPPDTVLLHQEIDCDFLIYLQDLGISLPRLEIIQDGVPSINTSSTLLVPYIVTEELSDWLTNHSDVEIFGSEPALVKDINNKFKTRKMAEKNGFRVTKGYFCNNQSELDFYFNLLCEEGFTNSVLKIPYGSSGKGLKKIENRNSFRTLAKFINRRATEFDLLIEAWHPAIGNINAQLWIDDSNVIILAITEQEIDENAVYLGTNFTPNYEEGIIKEYKKEILKLGKILKNKGYKGICGVDSIIDIYGKLFPVIEINARFTQVTYLLPLVEELANIYSNIKTRFVRFEAKEMYTFSEVYSKLRQFLSPDEKNKFIIYTFAKNTLPNQTKTSYRICILFFGNCEHKVADMVSSFSSFKIV
ncbi:ATP-grasp domain-containing protein [Paenibacillus polymyxa]|uniref:ATP-grasp domain-containing protein n=1 Tax=Paenibacillus polymyxa TaxID=1406 RepID=UPI001BEA90BC|nr:ATP-grasp domain-containing protein [Paenibacillus polymyxa]MBT2282938.1 ATP-grasp domain-containing protein [Paenibacillus polymyxa]